MLGVAPGVLCPDQSGDDEFRRTYYDAAVKAAYPAAAKAGVKASGKMPSSRPQTYSQSYRYQTR